MRCPRCSQEGFNPYGICAKCEFAGPPDQVEELSHIAFLLGELEAWREVSPSSRARLRTRYLRRRQELEIALGLRALPPTPEEIRKLRWELFCLAELQEEVSYWLERGWVHPAPAGRLRQGAQKRAEALDKRLENVPPAPPFDGLQDRLRLFDYLEEMLDRARQRGHFVDDNAHAAALADLRAERRELEIEAGLRPRPVEIAPAPGVEAPAPPPKPPKPPREPITWDRIWQTLLSERTLNVLLFLGAFLLVASATTYIVYNWETLPPAVQLGFIVLFTLSFYGAGWFLRTRMKLLLSGIAVTAIGSLLVPLDFYAVLVAGEVLPPEQWPWAWLMASAVCLPIYLFTALRIQAQFFGYLVAVAAGNLICAILYVLGVPPEWFLTALAALALALAVLAYRLRAKISPSPGGDESTPSPSEREGQREVESSTAESLSGRSPWSVLSQPFRFSSLVATAVILPLGIGWWIAAGASGSQFDASLALSWALGLILYAYAAVHERSPLLGRAAATALPVALLLLLRLAFERLAIETPWYALGWAALGPVYLWVGRRWYAQSAASPDPAKAGGNEGGDETKGGLAGDPILRAHSHTATGWGLALLAIAAVWSLFDLWAAAATHAALVAGVALAAGLWDRPRALPIASLLALSSMTFGMAAAHLEPAELCLGWALLALLHVLIALRLRTAPEYAVRLFGMAPAFAALALLPPLIFAHEPLLTYVLGHWIALAAWLVWLDRSGEHPGLQSFLDRLGPLRQSALHWAVALPLPFFVALLYTRVRAADAWLGLLLATLAWACFSLGRWRLDREIQAQGTKDWPSIPHRPSFPWYAVGYGCSIAAPLVALHQTHQPLLALTVLVASALYFASAWAFRAGPWLAPAGLALPLGLLILLDYWAVPQAQESVILALVVAAYLLGGVWLEQRRGIPGHLLTLLYLVAHLVALLAVGWGLVPAAERLFDDLPWSDAARLWAAAGQITLGVTYGLFAWFYQKERWAHAAAWLGVLAGGLIATAYSQGRGSSAFKAALLAAAYVLAERALTSKVVRQRWSRAERAWSLYRRPLLIAGWAVSAGAVVLALFRNLVLLGGGPVREAWAIAGLLTVTALYALSAWMFRRRLFVWLAGALVIAPWTVLTFRGWFLWDAPPPLPRYALAWTVLACLQLGFGLTLSFLGTRRGSQSSENPGKDYGFPLRVMANILLPLALFWGAADAATSSITWGLGLAFYVVSAAADDRWGLTGWQRARFLYPAVAVLPAWAIYLLSYFLPTAPYEVYGLLLLALALPLLALARLLRRVDLVDGVPLYLGAYGVAVVGTVLVAHQQPLLALALTFDALLCVLSAWLFREPLWIFPAAALAPAALLVALAQSHMVPPERRGWWLIALGADYLTVAWLLRRARRERAELGAYATPLLAAAFVVVALGLPPSSLDRAGAFWGYLAAALIYAVAAAWLRQPLLLAATAGLVAVPYGVALVWLDVNPVDYGLALFPGVAVALVLAHLLEWRLGRPGPILPSWEPKSWRLESLLDWWAGPWYTWGTVGALVAVGLSWSDSARLAIALALAAATFLYVTVRFRSRACLLLAGALAQGAAVAVIDAWGWLAYPAWAALAFLPVTVVTAALALLIERWRGESSPLDADWWRGWSRPFYLLLAIDLLVGQVAALLHADPGWVVTITHALLLGLLATVWAQAVLPFVAVGLGVAGLFQGMAWAGAESTSYPVGLALLGLGYGLVGYGVRYAWREGRRARIWHKPLEWTSLGLSAAALAWAAIAGPDVVGLLVRTLLGRTVSFVDYAARVQMVMWVLAITGLLYLATAVVRRWYVLGYGAVALLLAAWGLWWRFFMDMVGFQWYAVPAGLYLLGVGWMEWRQRRKALARWIDRAGMLVWLGTAWWQSLPGVMDSGWFYALLMGAEALLLVWWGSARRQKRFLYVGAAAVVLTAVTQAVEPLLSANRWIVFGIAGALLVSIAILVERNLNKIRELSVEMQGRLEGWE
jgi:hypothetical protein